jgi:hypothetical protein
MQAELVPDGLSDKEIKEELNRRTAKAGYTTRLGECPYRTKIMSGPPTKQYEDNYRRAFGHD